MRENKNFRHSDDERKRGGRISPEGDPSAHIRSPQDDKRSQSQLRLGLVRFCQNRWAVFCSWILLALYLSANFADFLSPYGFDNEDRNFSYCPPTQIEFFDENRRLTAPFVYGRTLKFDEWHKRIYQINTGEKYPVKFFAEGDAYKFLGFIPARVHLFTVDAPGRIYLWGADNRGRDLFTRLLYGARISLSIGVVGVAISFTIGLLVGGIAGFYSGWVDNVLMRVCEMFMMIPGFYLLMALRAAVPDNFNSLQIYWAITIIAAFIGWAGLARIIRGMALSLREREYVLAAKAIGVSDLGIIVRHILPHTFSYSIFAIMLSIPGYILSESVLSLLGLGIQDPIPSWGNLLSDALSIVQVKFAPWILLPGFFIFVTIICFNFIGDALRDALDPLFKAPEKS